VSSSWYTGLEAVQLIGDSEYGGAVPVVFGIMDATEGLGMRPVLLATNPRVVAAAQAQGREVWQFPGIVRRPRPIRDFTTAIRLAVALRKRRVRILHTHTSKGGMIGRLAGRLAGCDLVIHHTHGFYHSGLRPGVLRGFMYLLERFFARLDDYQVFVNTTEASDAADSGLVPRSKVKVVFNGVADPTENVDLDVAQMRSSWSIPDGSTVIGNVCRLATEQKGLDTCLRAFAAVRYRAPHAHMVLVGDGEDRHSLEGLADDLGVADAVHFVGYLPDAGALHLAFDITFAPSRREGQSVSVIEAMACGRPVVTTRIPGTNDLVLDGVTGLLTEVDDVDEMSKKLESLIRDPDRCRRLGAAARSKYESTFTLEEFHLRITRFYLECLRAVGR